jgi:CxxC-x17-CxxC domain-containing protein
MELQDKTLTCATCSREFTFTAQEQEFYQEKNFIEPKHCRECRQQRKLRRESYSKDFRRGEPRNVRSVSIVICAECGKPTQVPFKPLTGKPILCKDCFIKKRTEPKPTEVPPSRPAEAEMQPPEPVSSDNIIKGPEPLPDAGSTGTENQDTSPESQPTTESTPGNQEESPPGGPEDAAQEPKE